MDVAGISNRPYFVILTVIVYFCVHYEAKTENFSSVGENLKADDDDDGKGSAISIGLLPRTPPLPVSFYFDQDIHDHCKPKITEFANNSAKFFHCSLVNARPVTMCQSCVRRYLAVQKAYTAIIADDHGEDACKLYLLNADRIQIIKFTYKQIVNLWENSNCNRCFRDVESGELSNETLSIQRLANETYACVISHNVTVCTKDEKNVSHCTNLACKNCSGIYHRLNDAYESLVLKYGMLNLCMDTVDQVNNTRKVWSKEFSCVHFDNDTVVLFTLVAFFCACPIVFYLGSWIQSDEQKSKIMPQKRLATSRSAVQLSIN